MKVVTLSLAVLITASACQKASEDRHYDEEWKHFGAVPVSQATAADEAKIDADRLVNDVASEGDADEFLGIDANRIVFRSTFEGSMIFDSLRIVYDSPFAAPKTYRVEETAPYPYLKPTVEKMIQMPIRLVAEQTYGSELGSTFTQSIDAEIDTLNAANDSKPILSGDSASGVQVYNRVVPGASDCPDSLVCIDHMLVRPKTGEARSYCFYDAVTKQKSAIPIGATPGLRRAQLVSMLASTNGRFGPYLVRRFDSDAVDCDDESLKPAVESEVNIAVGIDTDDMILRRINASLINGANRADYGVKFENVLMNGDQEVSHLQAPFIDTLTALQSKTVYYFNESQAELVRIIKTLRRPVNFSLNSFDLSVYTGFLVDVEFKFCKDLLLANSKSYCD